MELPNDEDDEVVESEIGIGSTISNEISSVSVTPPSRLILGSSTDSDSSGISA